MTTTVKTFEHLNFNDFLTALLNHAAKGDYFDFVENHHVVSQRGRLTTAWPHVEYTTTSKKPTVSDPVASKDILTGDFCIVQFREFLNWIQLQQGITLDDILLNHVGGNYIKFIANKDFLLKPLPFNWLQDHASEVLFNASPTLFTWEGGKRPFKVIVTTPDNVEHANVTTSDYKYFLDTDQKKLGLWTISVEEADGTKHKISRTIYGDIRKFQDLELTSGDTVKWNDVYDSSRQLVPPGYASYWTASAGFSPVFNADGSITLTLGSYPDGYLMTGFALTSDANHTLIDKSIVRVPVTIKPAAVSTLAFADGKTSETITATDQDVQMVGTATGGKSPYTYKWTNTDTHLDETPLYGSKDTLIQSRALLVDGVNNFKVEVTDAAGAKIVKTFVINFTKGADRLTAKQAKLTVKVGSRMRYEDMFDTNLLVGQVTSSDPAVVSVFSAAGSITTLKPGKVTITSTAPASQLGDPALTASFELTVES